MTAIKLQLLRLLSSLSFLSIHSLTISFANLHGLLIKNQNETIMKELDHETTIKELRWSENELLVFIHAGVIYAPRTQRAQHPVIVVYVTGLWLLTRDIGVAWLVGR